MNEHKVISLITCAPERGGRNVYYSAFTYAPDIHFFSGREYDPIRNFSALSYSLHFFGLLMNQMNVCVKM